MAAKKKKKTKKPLISLELGWGGLAGLAAASFCIFLWMFLFGMWTGQSVLNSPGGQQKTNDSPGFASKIWSKKTVAPTTLTDGTAQSVAKKKTDAVAADEKETAVDEEASFFSVQVSAFKDKQRAAKSVAQWRARDYESFYLMPDLPSGKFHRVFVGRFDSLAEANTLAAKLESAEQRKVFIMLIAEDKERLP